MKSNDFTGKTVIPFCTSSSSVLDQSGELLADMAGTGDWQTGIRFASSTSEADVAEWANGLGIWEKRGQIKKAFLLTTTPTVGGNGDALIAAASAAVEGLGVQVRQIAVRDKKINFCQACYGCADTGACVQKDDFYEILQALHEADGVIVETPIYYNCAAVQALTVVNRLCSTFACKTYRLGPKKRVGMAV